MTSPLEQCPLPPPLDVNESDPATLWAEIWRLRHDSEGPGEYPTWKDAAIDERIKRVKAERAAIAAADAALAAQSEPDMRHPKIQALIGSRARREIELSIAEALLDDPAHEISGTDGDYWLPMHDKIVALQSDAPVAAQPLTDQDRMDAKRYRWLRDEDDGGEWACFDSSWLCKHDIYGEGPREMDAAIDMAMAAPKEPA